MTAPSPDEILAARILIVDDQTANVQLLERLLEQAGHRSVMSTCDPTAACALHRRHDFDLILLDLLMPVQDGFEVMAELTAASAGGYLPVIVLTAQPGHKLRALQAGAKDFISKPFDLLEVRTRIHNMLEVRLLYRRLAAHNEELEQEVQARTAALRDSEARYRSLAELASDWYWEQDESGQFTKLSGPVFEMLGLPDTDGAADDGAPEPPGLGGWAGWNEAERGDVRAAISERRPFLDFPMSRINRDGSSREFRVSGEPMFTPACRFIGYRGIGVETTARPLASAS